MNYFSAPPTICARQLLKRTMDAAFSLAATAPAPGANVLAFLRAACARRASDRGEAEALERMTRQIEFFENPPHLRLREIRQWIELQARPVGLDNGEALPFVPVEALAAVEPRIVIA